MLKRVALQGEDVMVKAYGYTRVSTMEQATGGDSLTVQRQAIERHAKALGKRLAHVYVDEGVSGSKSLEKRPQGRALLLAVQRGDIQRGDVIIASKLDRMFRSAQDAHNVSAIFRKRGISLSLLDLMGGDDVTGDGMAKSFFGMASVFANLERDRIGERIREVKAEHRREGRHLGGSRPFGFTIGKDGHLRPVPKEQNAIRLIRRLRAKKYSLRKIAQMVQLRFPNLKISHTTVGQVSQRRD